MKQLKIIGRTYDNLNVFKLSKEVAMSANGDILKIDKTSFLDTVYTVASLPKRTSLKDIKKHIVCPYKITVSDNKYIVDTINHKLVDVISGENNPYIYIDIEDSDSEELKEAYSQLTDEEVKFINTYEAIEFVKYKNCSYIIDENETSIYFKNSNDSKELLAIEDAHDFEVSKYEEFNNLDLDRDDDYYDSDISS